MRSVFLVVVSILERDMKRGNGIGRMEIGRKGFKEDALISKDNLLEFPRTTLVTSNT